MTGIVLDEPVFNAAMLINDIAGLRATSKGIGLVNEDWLVAGNP